MTHLALTPNPPGVQLTQLDETARNYAQASRAEATKRAYESQIRAWTEWSGRLGLQAMPADPLTIARYLSDRARSGFAVATLAQALVALSRAHVALGYPSPRTDPTLREVWRGICRTEGTRPKRQAKALPVPELRKMARASKASPGLPAARDRALLLVGFAGGFRRSELVGLDVADLRADLDGLVLTVRRSKTDQLGAGREVAIPYGSDPVTCPVRALNGWLEAAGITSGPLFRGVRKGGKVRETRLTADAVSDLIRCAASRAHVSPTGLSGHSLRAGLVTAASKAGKSLRSIQDQTGHKSAAMVARYIRSATLFEDNAASGVGL